MTCDAPIQTAGGRMANGQDRKGRRKGGGQFVPIPYPMLQSDAWRSLNGNAVRLWVELRGRYNGKNNGDLSVSHDEAVDLLAIGRATVGRAFGQLEDRGFIRKTRQGSRRGRLATTWAITDRPMRPGEPATNGWQRWRFPKTDRRFSGGTMRSVAFRKRTRGGEKF
jgi:hypothetical protein